MKIINHILLLIELFLNISLFIEIDSYRKGNSFLNVLIFKYINIIKRMLVGFFLAKTLILICPLNLANRSLDFIMWTIALLIYFGAFAEEG